MHNSWTLFTTLELTGNEVYISDIVEDTGGAIWVATDSAGLLRFSDGEWSSLSSTDPGVGLPGDSITCITVAPDGSLWFGLWNNGAARFDGSEWTVYRDGLIDQTVNDIFFDPNGAIWFATLGGVSRLSP